MAWEPLPRGFGTEPKPIGAALDRVARSLGAPSADVLTQIFGHWSDLVGAGVADHATPLSLDDTTLSVTVSDPAWSTQLRLLEPLLLERLASQLGPGAVTKIVVRVRVD
ncbi:MAG: DUF721 domain-containing protein [Acidimicrobiia bacterium]|nr:DUF721 domain-containing protein [Acidimicrobiia bacterium]